MMAKLRMGQSSSDALKRVNNQGFRFSDAPKSDVPGLPDDITLLSDEELMELFTRLTGWSDYVSTQAAMAVIDEREAERMVDYAEANAVASNWSGASGDRVAIAKAKIGLDPEVKRLKEEHQDRYAYRKLIETLQSNLERDSALVSRELTRRTAGSTPVIRRKNNWTL